MLKLIRIKGNDCEERQKLRLPFKHCWSGEPSLCPWMIVDLTLSRYAADFVSDAHAYSWRRRCFLSTSQSDASTECTYAWRKQRREQSCFYPVGLFISARRCRLATRLAGAVGNCYFDIFLNIRKVGFVFAIKLKSGTKHVTTFNSDIKGQNHCCKQNNKQIGLIVNHLIDARDQKSISTFLNLYSQVCFLIRRSASETLVMDRYM